jgi:hypothetical protein
LINKDIPYKQKQRGFVSRLATQKIIKEDLQPKAQ